MAGYAPATFYLERGRKMKKSDVRGQRFNKLTAIEPCGKTKYGNIIWRFRCDCGNVVEKNLGNVVNGHTKSCGCYSKKKITTKTNPRLYSIYKNMKKRCYYRNDINYKHYGARGITVCNEWLDDFTTFYDWAIANGYSDELSIDRINVNGNYEPTNCRWATFAEQARNRTDNAWITFNGKTKIIEDWSKELGIKRNTLDYRIKSGWNLQDAFSKIK